VVGLMQSAHLIKAIMANFAVSIQKTLAHEGGFAHIKATGEVVNFGITHWFLREIGELPPAPRSTPARPTEIAHVRALTREKAIELYREHFWRRLNIGSIRDQDLADKVFDLAVNMGARVLFLLQETINDLRGRPLLAIDGILGPVSIQRINTTNAAAALDLLRDKAARRYRQIAIANKALAPNLDNWLTRLATA
jgi:lysozyme family protein